jgi:hypothetical protein
VKILHEIDRTGQVVRIFHRAPSGSSWTHAPGEVYRYFSRSHQNWVPMRCECPVNGHQSAEKVPERI